MAQPPLEITLSCDTENSTFTLKYGDESWVFDSVSVAMGFLPTLIQSPTKLTVYGVDGKVLTSTLAYPA